MPEFKRFYKEDYEEILNLLDLISKEIQDYAAENKLKEFSEKLFVLYIPWLF